MARHAQAARSRRRAGTLATGSATSRFAADWIGRHLGCAEHRRVALLVCGMPAKAGMRNGSNQEEMAETFGHYRSQARHAVEEFGGSMIEQPRCALVACWGLSKASDHYARLAVRAALRVAELQVAELRPICAIETGTVVASPDAGEAKAADLLGPLLQKAEELLAFAQPGWVIVSEAFRPFADRHFGLERIPAHGSAKGWRVTGAQPGSRQAFASAGSLVGHLAERQALDEVWLRVVDGLPQCVSISGEAGIGKSRLVRYFEQKVKAASGTWIEIGCLPETRCTPLRPLRRAICELLANRAAGLAEFLGALGEADRNLFEFLLRGCGERVENYIQANTCPQQWVFTLVLDWIAKRATCGPTVVAIEDIHWADPATLDFVTRFCERLGSMGPVCLLWTSRGTERRSFRTTAQRTRLALTRLTSAEIQQLLACSQFGAALSPAIRRQIAIRSEGIPLFATELARLVAGSREGQDSMDLLLEPGPLNAVLSARLDSLGHLKPLAQAAAVIGRDFDVSVLALVLQMECGSLIAALQELVASGIVEPAPGQTDNSGYRFTHALLRDAAYASVLKAHRRELHRRVATILAQDEGAGRLWPEIVARHYTAGGDRKKAFTWWHKAGMRAAEVSSTRAAVAHLNQALAARREDPEAGSPREEVEVLRLLGVQLAALKGNGAPEVVETLQRCLALSRMIDGPEGDFDAMWTLHSCYLVRGDIKMALDLGERLTANADQNGPEERRLRAHRMQGLAKLLGGRLEEAFAHYGLVLEIYDEARHAELRFRHASDQGALAYAHLAWGEAIAGRLESSNKNAAAALRLSSRLQHPHTSAHVLCVLAAQAQTLGDRQAASALAFAGRTLGERHEFPYWTAWADIILGWIHGERDSEGISRIENAIRAYRRTGATQALPYALLLLAETALCSNRPRRALTASEEGWELAQQHGLLLYASELLRLRAAAEFRLGQPSSRVLKLAAEAEILAANQGAETFRSRAAEFRTHCCAAIQQYCCQCEKSEP